MINKIIILFLTVALLSSCENKQPAQTTNKKVVTNSLELKYAKWFKVEYLKDYKRISVFNPWNKSIYWEYHIFNKKQETKNTLNLSELNAPEKSIVLSSTQIAMFDKLTIIDKITSVANVKYISNTKIRQKVKQGKVRELGDASTLNVEKTYLEQADVIFATAWDKIDPKFEKLIEQNIPIAFVMDWQEESPLARAEWIKFVAAFYNLEDEAQIIFDSIEYRYTSLIKLANNTKEKPSVLHGTPMSGTWYIAGGNSFAAKFYKNAGANYLWKDDSTTGSIPLSFEAVFKKAEKADFWFNSSSSSNTSDLLDSDERYALLESFRNKNIFSNGAKIDAKFSSKFWEEGIVNPDQVLKDIISIIHPKLLPEHELRFYRQLN